MENYLEEISVRSKRRIASLNSLTGGGRVNNYLSKMVILLLIIFIFLSYSNAAQSSPHDKISQSLVYIHVYGETESGIPIETFGTGTIITSDGIAITSYHLFKPFQGKKIIDETFKITASIGLKTSQPYDAVTVDMLESRDLAKINLIGIGNNAFTPSCIDRSRIIPEGSLVFTSGFPRLMPYIKDRGNVVSINGPRGSLVVRMKSSDGQSGSPVYNKYSRIVGILKGHFENDPSLSIVIPSRDFTVFWPPESEFCRTASTSSNQTTIKRQQPTFSIDSHNFRIIRSGISPAPEISKCSGMKEISAANELKVSVVSNNNTHCAHAVTASFIANNSKFSVDHQLKYSIKSIISNDLRKELYDGGSVTLVKTLGGAPIYNSKKNGDSMEIMLKNKTRYYFYINASTYKRLSKRTDITLLFTRLTN